MNANHDERTDEREALFLSAAGREAAPVDEAFLARLREQSTEAFMAAADEAPPPAGRYKIMNANTLKWFIPVAAAAAIVLLAVGTRRARAAPAAAPPANASGPCWPPANFKDAPRSSSSWKPSAPASIIGPPPRWCRLPPADWASHYSQQNTIFC